MTHPLADNMYDHDQIQGQSSQEAYEAMHSPQSGSPTSPQDNPNKKASVEASTSGNSAMSVSNVLPIIPDPQEQLIKILGLDRTNQNQLIPANLDDFQSDWTFTVSQLLDLFAHLASEAKPDRLRDSNTDCVYPRHPDCEIHRPPLPHETANFGDASAYNDGVDTYYNNILKALGREI